MVIAVHHSYPSQAVAFPIVVTIVAWFMVVVAFGIGTNTDDANGRISPGDSITYPFWIVCFSGPFLLAAVGAHTALWRPYSSVFGGIVSSNATVKVATCGVCTECVHG